MNLNLKTRKLLEQTVAMLLATRSLGGEPSERFCDVVADVEGELRNILTAPLEPVVQTGRIDPAPLPYDDRTTGWGNIITGFRPGIYQHWKGNKYLALFLVEDSTNRVNGNDGHDLGSTQEAMVVYISLSGEHIGQRNVRSLAQWNETGTVINGEFVTVTGRGAESPVRLIPRFQFVGA